MKSKLFLAVILGFVAASICKADDIPAYFKFGPLELNIPLKTTSVTYLYDFRATQNLVGAETPVISLWNKVEGTVGVVTSLQGHGTPFIGGDIQLGSLLDRWVNLGPINIGGFGGRNFNSGEWMYGLKASTKLWG